jgi:NADH dehydrogenase FAD-containing subunit
LKRIYPNIAHLAKISIVDASGGILNSFDASLATYARDKFKRDHIDLLLNRKVKEVQRGNLIVEPDGEIPFGMLVWSTGICASPLVKRTTSIAKDDSNSYFLTDDHLRALDNNHNPFDNIFAIGDCAQIKDKFLACTAQVASQKAKHLAYVLNGQMDDDHGEKIFKHKDMGAMASLGSGSAIIDSPNAKAHGRVCLPSPSIEVSSSC